MKRQTIPNPGAGAGALRPVSLITDRAKRYRAQVNAWPAPLICHYCGAPATLIDHVDGDEDHGDPDNLVQACRPCNVRKAGVFKDAQIGRATVQYNPAAHGAETLAEWAWCTARILRRDKKTGRLLPPDRWKTAASPDEIRRAVATIRATPRARRLEFQQELAAKRRAGEVPF